MDTQKSRHLVILQKSTPTNFVCHKNLVMMLDWGGGWGPHPRTYFVAEPLPRQRLLVVSILSNYSEWNRTVSSPQAMFSLDHRDAEVTGHHDKPLVRINSHFDSLEWARGEIRLRELRASTRQDCFHPQNQDIQRWSKNDLQKVISCHLPCGKETKTILSKSCTVRKLSTISTGMGSFECVQYKAVWRAISCEWNTQAQHTVKERHAFASEAIVFPCLTVVTVAMVSDIQPKLNSLERFRQCRIMLHFDLGYFCETRIHLIFLDKQL